MERHRAERWQGQAELGAAIDAVNVFDFLESEGKVKRADLERELAQLKDEPEPKPRHRSDYDDDEYEYQEESPGTPTQKLARSIRTLQRKADALVATLSREQRRHLGYLLARAKEGGVRFWAKQGNRVVPLVDFDSFVRFAAENNDAEHLHVAGEFLKRGVYYLSYEALLVPTSNAHNAEIALSYLDEVKRLHNRKAPPEAFARIEQYLSSGGTEEGIASYIEAIQRLKQALADNHLRLEEGLFELLTNHVEHGEYREQLAQLDAEELAFTASAIKKFMHPSKFRTEVGAREFLAVADFVKRNKSFFAEAIETEKDWTDLSSSLNMLFKAPSEQLSKVPDRELFGRYADMSSENAQALGDEVCRQFPEIEELCRVCGIDGSELTTEAGTLVADVLLRFSNTAERERYFIHRDYNRYNEPNEAFTRFAILGNFARRLLADKEQLDFITDHFTIRSFSDLFFVGTLLEGRREVYTKRTEALTQVLGGKIDVTNNVHYHLFHDKVQRRWMQDPGEDMENLQAVIAVLGKDAALPFPPVELETNLGGEYDGRPGHYGIAWQFEIKSDHGDEAADEQRTYLRHLQDFYAQLDHWQGDQELLEGAKEDGVFDPPFERNILRGREITILYDMEEPARTLLAETLGYPKYDFSDEHFYVLANAALGNVEHVFSLFTKGREVEAELVERILQVLPEAAKASLQDISKAYFGKQPRKPGPYDDEGEIYGTYEVHAMTPAQLAFLEHIYGKESDAFHELIAFHLQAISSDDVTVLKHHTMGSDLPPALAYALAQRTEAWVDKNLCNKLVGESYYDVYRAKNFVFEQRIREQGITAENWLLAYYLMYDRHTVQEFDHSDELAQLMDTPEARKLIREGVRRMFSQYELGARNDFQIQVKEEMQSLAYLEPAFFDKLFPGVDVEALRDSFHQPYYRSSERAVPDFKPWPATRVRDDVLLRIEYLLEPADRKALYAQLNEYLGSAVEEKLQEKPGEERISLHDVFRFISSTPYPTDWVDAQKLQIADFTFSRNGDERFTQYFKENLPLTVTAENWVSLLNLYTYQTDKELEGFRELEAFIKSPDTLQKLTTLAKERFVATLDGTHTPDAQDQILQRFLTDYRAQEHGGDFDRMIMYAQQTAFMKQLPEQEREPTARALKRCLDIESRDAYVMSLSLVVQAAGFVRTTPEAMTTEGLDSVFEFLLSQDTGAFFETMLDDRPHTTPALIKKAELIQVMNFYKGNMQLLLGTPLPLEKSLQFVSAVLKDSVENIKKLRFLAKMTPEYLQIVRTTLEHSPKEFLRVLDLLNVAQTFEMPIAAKFSEFVSQMPNLTPERLAQLYRVLDKDAIKERQDARKKSVQKKIDRVERRLAIERTPSMEERLQTLLQELEFGTTEKDHFLDLIDRLQKASQRKDMRMQEALKKEVREYLTPVMVRAFERKVTDKVVGMVKDDFGLESFDFDRITSGEFTAAYRMYKRLYHDHAPDARKVKAAFARYIQNDKPVWSSFKENTQWIAKAIPNETKREQFMSANKREYDVGNMTGSNIDGQVEHFVSEAKRCLTALNELSQLSIPIPDNPSEQAFIQIFRDLKGREWTEEERPLFDDLKVQIDALEQLMTLRHARGTLPKRISIERELDPIKITQMGTVVQGSCLHADGANYWSAFTNALEANKMLFWVKDEQGTILARVLCAVDANKNIVRFPAYYTGASSLDANLFFNQYLRDFGETYGFGLNGSTYAVDNLVVSRWYKDPEVEVE